MTIIDLNELHKTKKVITMKALIDNSNNEAVFTASDIEYTGRTATIKDDEQNIILIIGDMNPDNSRIVTISEIPADFHGRNYKYENGSLVKKEDPV